MRYPARIPHPAATVAIDINPYRVPCPEKEDEIEYMVDMPGIVTVVWGTNIFISIPCVRKKHTSANNMRKSPTANNINKVFSLIGL